MSGITIRETGRGYDISFPFNQAIISDIKTIQGSYWRGKDKVWFVPAYREREVDMLKRKYGIMIDPVLEMAEQVGRLDPLPELTIDISLKRDLFAFQKQGVAKGLEWGKFINGDDMGTGKSSQAIATAIALKCQCILVICTNTAKYNWQNEWNIVAGKKSMILEDTKANWHLYYKEGMINVFIVNYESLRRFFIKPNWKKPKNNFRLKDIPFKTVVDLFDCIIVDESHNVCNELSLQSMIVRGLAERKSTVMLLTGTLLINKVRDVLHQLIVIDRLREMVAHIPQPRDERGNLIDYSGYVRFLNRYCDGGSGESNLNELRYRLRKICFFRREKSEVLKDLPDKMRQLVYCELSNRKEYDEYEKEFVKYLKDIKASNEPNKERLLAGQMLIRMGKLRQISAMGKVDVVKDYVNQINEAGRKIVIFAHHNEVITKLKKTFPDAASVTGQDKKEHREKSIQSFQKNPKVNKNICSLDVAGESINLTAASDLAYIELPLTNAKLEQSLDRCHRYGQKNNVVGTLFIAKKSIDQYIYFKIILKKKELAEQVTGIGFEDNPLSEVDSLLNFFTQPETLNEVI